MTHHAADTSDREIATTRMLKAPRARVWKAWTDPAEIVQWWGPNGFTNTTKEMTVKPGGLWRFIMHGPDGTDYPNVIEYQEVVEPERLVYLHGDEGDSPDARFQVTVTFEEAGADQTTLTMRMLFPTAAEREKVIKEYGAIEGQKQTLARLEQHLATM